MGTILLRPWERGDRAVLTALVAAIDRTYLSSRLPDPFTEEAAQAFLENAISKEGTRGVFRAITEDGRVVGSVSAEMQDFPEGARDANLSCWLHPQVCGRGYGAQAVRQITALAFDALPVVRLTAWICAPNLPSRRCAEKAGFTREALLRQAAAHGEDNWDLTIYGKLRSEQ